MVQGVSLFLWLVVAQASSVPPSASCEGFSEEFGARNLERVMNRLLGTPIAEALLGGKFTAGQTIRAEANGDQIRLR